MMPVGFEMKPIGDCVQEISSWNPERDGGDEEICYLDLSSVSQETKTVESHSRVLAKDAPSRARQLVRSGDILVSTVRPNLNGVARVPDSFDGATASTGFCVLRPDSSKLLGEYLLHWVKTPAFVLDMTRKATGASYPAVSDRIIHESLLPLPPLHEQQRTAAILDQAEALRTKRRLALGKLDTLTQSLFLDLFGDPRTNPNDWPFQSLAKLGRVVTGGTPPSAMEGMFGGDIPFITPGDLESDEPVKRTLTEAGADESRTVRAGATLVCCIGATIGKMGKAAQRSAFNQQINAVEWGEDINDEFGLATLRFFKSKIAGAGASTTLPILKKSAFQQIEIPVPPIDLQEEFSRRATVVERVRGEQMQSQLKLDALFASLQHRAFRGEL